MVEVDDEFKQKLIELLPIIIEEDPKLATTIYYSIRDKVIVREEFKEWLEKSERRFNDIIIELREFRADANKRFEESQKQFNELLKRFDKHEERFNELLKRFDEHEQENERRFNELLLENRKLREDTNKRFDAMQKQMNRRFEAVDKRFEALQKQMDKRFEAVDKRFDAVNKRFEAVDKRFEAMEERFEKMKDWVGVVVGGFQRRAGRNLEEAVANTLSIALKLPAELRPTNIKLRQKIVDTKGIIGKPGRKYEYDLYVSDDVFIVFEVGASKKLGEIEWFNDKALLVQKHFKVSPNKLIKALITLDKRPEVVKLCKKLGIMLG
jgi:hypothetical protein